jgi:hypothetical protein
MDCTKADKMRENSLIKDSYFFPAIVLVFFRPQTCLPQAGLQSRKEKENSF